MNEGDLVCAACQKPAALEFSLETIEGPAPAAAPEAPETPAAAEAVKPEPAPAVDEKKSSNKLILGVVAVLAVAAIAAVTLLGGKSEPKEPEVEPGTSISEEGTVEGEETPFVAPVSYVREEADFTDELVNTVVAKCADSELTNQKLAYYYWREYYSFASSYSAYLYYVMDPTARLDTQSYAEDTSWDMLFMDYAMNSYHTLAAAAAAAAEEGYELTESDQAVLAGLEAELTAFAESNGLADADAYLQSCFGPYCDLESYTTFMEEYMLGASWLSAKLDAAEVTDEALNAYYEENLETYETNGLVKDDTSMINVRHILIMPEAVEIAEGEAGYEEAVQTASENAKAKADEIYAAWQAGDQTEESFAALATEHTEDGGSQSTGGLYENVYPGQMVEAFNDWCFDEARAEGDTAIVETEYGYHIMYFVDTVGESYWHSVVSADYQNAIYSKLCQQAQQDYPIESDLTQAAVYPCNTVS